MTAVETRGRPRLRDDEEILVAALQAFAAHGFDSMSVRTLNADLGLSNGTINQRFGSKEQLYFAAVDHGFDTFLAEIDAERNRRPVTGDDLDALRELIRAFLLTAARRPELGRLMNQEGLHHTDRLDYIRRTVIDPTFATTGELIDRLVAAGRIHPVSSRLVFFLVAHGAEAPYTLTALSAAFDDHDGPLDIASHAETVTDVIVRGLIRSSQPVQPPQPSS